MNEKTENPTTIVEVYAFIGGHSKIKKSDILMLKDPSMDGPFTIDVTFFLIKHGNSWVTFDTGFNIMVAKDPVGYLGQCKRRRF